MKLKVKITESSHKKLSEIIAEFNEMPYRLNDIKLTKSQLEIDLGNLPIFWDQFLEHVPSLKKELKPAFIDAMREIPEEKIGVSFNKAMAVLSQD
jgi:hypothetical protein